MKAVFLADAKLELAEAADFYEQKKIGLGSDFLDEIARSVAEVELYPLRWPRLQKGVRRRLLRRFPYGLIYRIAGDQIIIVAVMHLHRKPSYWRKRRQPG